MMQFASRNATDATRTSAYSCQIPSRSSGTAAPPASTPSISTSGEPTMKSVWVADWLRPAATCSSSGTSSRAHGSALPQAM